MREIAAGCACCGPSGLVSVEVRIGLWLWLWLWWSMRLVSLRLVCCDCSRHGSAVVTLIRSVVVVSPWLQSCGVEACVGVGHQFARGEAVRVRFVCAVAPVWRRSPWFPVCTQEGPQQPAGDASLVGGVYEGSPFWDSSDR